MNPCERLHSLAGEVESSDVSDQSTNADSESRNTSFVLHGEKAAGQVVLNSYLPS